MKRNTLELLKVHLDSFAIHFRDNRLQVTHYLDRTELRQLLLSEYGKAPKKKLKLKAGFKRLMDDLLRFAVSELKGENDA